MAMSDQRFELKLADGHVVEWVGRDGENAAQRYADAFPGATVLAWRWPSNFVASVHPGQIIG